MLKFFKNLFYNKECYNKIELLDKLECIYKNINIDPYGSVYSLQTIEVIEENIASYIDSMEEQLKLISIDGDIRFMKSISENTIKNITFSTWYTDNDRSILDNDVFKLWVKKAIELVTTYNVVRSNMNKTKLYAYSIKLRPYIINIETIADIVIENQLKEQNMT